MLTNNIPTLEQFDLFSSKIANDSNSTMELQQESAQLPAPSTPSRMGRFRNALDRSRNGMNRSRNGIAKAIDRLNRSRNGGDLNQSRNGLDKSLSGLGEKEENTRIQSFGKNRKMWEEKGLKNTPAGITPEKLSSKSKPITIEDDKMPPSARCRLPGEGGDIIIRKGCVGNIHLLKGISTGVPPDEEAEKFSSFPSIVSSNIVADILAKQKELRGKPYPDGVAFTLWATDNMNVYGKSLAQIFALLGVRFVKDSVDDIELVPLIELKRPRVDVIVSCSGVFRDLFINQMALIDRAVKMAAEAKEPPEMNFVRKHSFQLTQELGNLTLREAATRVFSNAAGSYSANIAAWVKSNEWESELQLQRQFLARKCYAFNSDKPGMMEYKSELFRACLRSCEVVVQNLDLNDILSITDVPHYYDADPTKVIQALRFDDKKPLCLLAKTIKDGTEVEVYSLSETIRLDAMSKILSPDYFERVLSQSKNGVRDISNCLRNILGWAVTSGEVDTFIFDIANSLFLEDPKMQLRLREKDNINFRNMVATFLKAGEHGYWDTSDAKIRRLRELKKYAESEI
mmetsp:Transcript_6591/g.9631  ORF Transcript_6591/g.9631 Transcript_6591/m.9631 type:complete len:570 (+) Transcript_6591:233-1942(+)